MGLDEWLYGCISNQPGIDTHLNRTGFCVEARMQPEKSSFDIDVNGDSDPRWIEWLDEHRRQHEFGDEHAKHSDG